MFRIALAVLALGLLQASALAHGSVYRAPSELPPGLRDPADPVPPPELAPFTGGQLSWEWWWSLSKDDLLPRRAETPEVAEKTIDERVLPAMASALEAKLSCPDKARTILALGSVGSLRGGLPRDIEARFRELMTDKGQQTIVQVACALAFALSRSTDAETRASLTFVIRNGNARGPTRGSAALALGLLPPARESSARSSARNALRFGARPESATNLRCCALLAMGLSGDPEHLPDLRSAFRATSGAKDDLVSSHAVAGLGKLAEALPRLDPAVFDLLKEALTREGKWTTRAAVIALGQLGTRPDLPPEAASRTVQALRRVLTGDDERAAGLAAISLGRLAGATPVREVRSDALDALEKAVLGDAKNARTFAALGLGLAGSGARDRELSRIRVILKRALETAVLVSRTPGTPPEPNQPAPTGDPVAPGACALALALSGFEAAAPDLARLVSDPLSHGRLRGYGALSLSVLRAPGTTKVILDGYDGNKDGDYMVLAALAAGFTGGTDLGPSLLELQGRKDVPRFRRTLMLRALGKLGDPRTLSGLLAILENGKESGTARSVAAVAIADLLDRPEAMVLPRLTKDLNAPATGTVALILSVL